MYVQVVNVATLVAIMFTMRMKKDTLQLRLEEQVQCMASLFSDRSFQINI